MAPPREYKETSLHLKVVEYLNGEIKSGRNVIRLQTPFPGLLFTAPSGETRDEKEAYWHKMKGYRAGTPDLILWNKVDGKSLSMAIELKAVKGVQSLAQKDFQIRFEEHGGKYAVCRSVGEVRDTLIRWGLACKNTNAIEPKPTHSEMLAFQKAMYTPV